MSLGLMSQIVRFGRHGVPRVAGYWVVSMSESGRSVAATAQLDAAAFWSYRVW